MQTSKTTIGDWTYGAVPSTDYSNTSENPVVSRESSWDKNTKLQIAFCTVSLLLIVAACVAVAAFWHRVYGTFKASTTVAVGTWVIGAVVSAAVVCALAIVIASVVGISQNISQKSAVTAENSFRKEASQELQEVAMRVIPANDASKSVHDSELRGAAGHTLDVSEEMDASTAGRDRKSSGSPEPCSNYSGTDTCVNDQSQTGGAAGEADVVSTHTSAELQSVEIASASNTEQPTAGASRYY